MAKAVEDGPQSVELTKVVEWATKELSGFYDIEDHVNAISGNFLDFEALYIVTLADNKTPLLPTVLWNCNNPAYTLFLKG